MKTNEAVQYTLNTEQNNESPCFEIIVHVQCTMYIPNTLNHRT